MKSAKTSKWFTIFFAILPLVMMYKVPGTEIRIPTLLTAFAMLFSITQLVYKRMLVSPLLLAPFFLYLAYVMTKSTLQLAFLCVAVMFIIASIFTGVVNVSYLRRILEKVAVVAAVCVIIQQITHIVLGLHIPFHIGPLLADDIAGKYSYLLSTGIAGESMYRPCAFFLEPSHYSQYCVIGLGSCLFSTRFSYKRALLITLGVIASTSGMGFVSVLLMWCWWWLNRNRKEAKSLTIKRLIIVIPLAFLAFVIFDHISFTHSIINRFTTSDSGEYNAITGRLFWWDAFFGDFSVNRFLFGFGLESLPEDIYFTGFMKQLFCYGIIGVLLLGLFLVMLMLKSDKYGMACVAIYIGLLFFSELTTYNNLLFYIGTFIALYVSSQQRVHEIKIKF